MEVLDMSVDLLGNLLISNDGDKDGKFGMHTSIGHFK